MERQEREPKGMEWIYSRLFGETKWQQEKKLKRLLIITAIIIILSVIEPIEEPILAVVIFLILLLIWGWGFVSATAKKAAGIIAFFNNDIAIFVITIVYWLMFGSIIGAIALVLGIIRFIQIKMDNRQS